MRPVTTLLTSLVLCLLLLTTLPAAADEPLPEQWLPESSCAQEIAADAIYLDLNHRSSETMASSAPMCFASHLPAAGYWLIEATADSSAMDRLRLEVRNCSSRTVFRTLSSAVVAVPGAGTGAFCIVPAPDFDSLASVRLTARFLGSGDFVKSDPDEAETDPDPAPVPPPGKAALSMSPLWSRDQVRAFCERHDLISSDSELCAPRLDRGSKAVGRLDDSEVHSYQIFTDRWLAVTIDWTGSNGQAIELLGPQGHSLAQGSESQSSLFETLGPGTYTLRVRGAGTYSVTWSGSTVR